MQEWRELKQTLKGLAGVARLTMLYHLARRPEITVTELTDLLHLSQPLVSWHLRMLKRAGLIETRRAGRQVYCSLNSERVRSALEGLENLLNPALQMPGLPTGNTLIEADSGSE
jgi:ArsR family transcriptional regulator